jgi:hypothetical protein
VAAPEIRSSDEVSEMSDFPDESGDSRVMNDGGRLRRGGCSCGAVRFEVKGEPDVVGTCHCTDCRKATGSTYVYYGDWPRSAFTSWGSAIEFRGRSFCPICGSRLFHLSDAKAEIMLGALDAAPGDLAPTREGWIKRREHWLVPIVGTGQFDQDPE